MPLLDGSYWDWDTATEDSGRVEGDSEGALLRTSGLFIMKTRDGSVISVLKFQMPWWSMPPDPLALM